MAVLLHTHVPLVLGNHPVPEGDLVLAKEDAAADGHLAPKGSLGDEDWLKDAFFSDLSLFSR